MTTLPEHMIDRWDKRKDTAPGQGTVYWHMLMKDHPQVVSMARQAQQRLARFPGLHMTPLDRLHMTTMIAGPAEHYTGDQLQEMITSASELLSHIPPIPVTVGGILYHPEAIMLAVGPAQALTPIRQAIEEACMAITGQAADDARRWRPHITICYSTMVQPVQPLIQTLGSELDRREIRIDSASLVIQHGPERLWDWQTIGTVRLPAPART
jgi:2'-5' RNA ligase